MASALGRSCVTTIGITNRADGLPSPAATGKTTARGSDAMCIILNNQIRIPGAHPCTDWCQRLRPRSVLCLRSLCRCSLLSFPRSDPRLCLLLPCRLFAVRPSFSPNSNTHCISGRLGSGSATHVSRSEREGARERERDEDRGMERKASHTSALASASLSVARFGDSPAGASSIFIPSSRARALLSPKPAACSSKVLAWATLRSTTSPATHAGAKAAVT